MKLSKQLREDFVNDVMKSVPFASKYDWNMLKQDVQARARESLPEEVKICLAKYPEHFTLASVYVRAFSSCLYIYKGQKLENVVYTDLITKYENYKKEMENRERMSERLMEVAKSVTTTNRLKEMLPELASFVPEDYVVNKLLPTTTSGVVSDLIKLGLKVSK